MSYYQEREQRALIFKDTLAYCDARLEEENKRVAAELKVYEPGFVSPKRIIRREDPDYPVWNCSTFTAASRFALNGQKTAVLNFANAVCQGGGVLEGASAQEETLCRCSNLYPALMSDKALREYYEPHRAREDYDATDRVIYTPGITVFRDDRDYHYLAEPFKTDVITCAAPVNHYEHDADWIRRIFRNRIINILETAMDNDVEVLVLGAFGCGAFRNPPEIVAEVFKEVLVKESYGSMFDQVVFAVLAGRKPENEQVFRVVFDPAGNE